MGVLQGAFEKAIRGVPRQALGKLLTDKLKAQDISLSVREVDRLAARLLETGVNHLTVSNWKWWQNRDITIEFTEADTREIERQFELVASRIGDIVDDATNELTPSILSTLRRNWAKQRRYERKTRSGFERRLAQRWGPALENLHMLLVIAREFGESMLAELQASDLASTHQLEVLSRLQARACQVAYEVLVLLASGLADGAMARWRTLHEIATMALFIGSGGEDLAKRYVLHQGIEAGRAAKEYAAYQDRLNEEPITKRELDEIETAYSELIDRYGSSYGGQYGWAAHHLGVSAPRFSDIENAAGIDHLRPYYRMASHNVHGNPKGVFFKLGLLDEVDVLLAGPSNAGLADPGHSAAISLVQASVPLGTLRPTMDSIVGLRLMLALVDEIGEAFGRAHELLLASDSD